MLHRYCIYIHLNKVNEQMGCLHQTVDAVPYPYYPTNNKKSINH
jgi:hypothetical protein